MPFLGNPSSIYMGLIHFFRFESLDSRPESNNVTANTHFAVAFRILWLACCFVSFQWVAVPWHSLVMMMGDGKRELVREQRMQ